MVPNPYPKVKVAAEVYEAVAAEAESRGISMAAMLDEILAPSLGLSPRAPTQRRTNGQPDRGCPQISVTAELRDRLRVEAQARGVSVRAFATDLLERELNAAGAPEVA